MLHQCWASEVNFHDHAPSGVSRRPAAPWGYRSSGRGFARRLHCVSGTPPLCVPRNVRQREVDRQPIHPRIRWAAANRSGPIGMSSMKILPIPNRRKTTRSVQDNTPAFMLWSHCPPLFQRAQLSRRRSPSLRGRCESLGYLKTLRFAEPFP